MAATAFGPSLASAASTSAARSMILVRGDREVGSKTVSVTRNGEEVDVETRIDIAVTFLGVTAYEYTLRSRETWVGGALQRLRAETNDDGSLQFANADLRDGRLVVSGSAYSGEAISDAATTSYWSPAFLNRKVWLSTQDGRLLDIRATNLGVVSFPTSGGSVQASRWRITGDLTDLYLYFDAAQEWIGSEFPARGETARFITVSGGQALTPLWVNA